VLRFRAGFKPNVKDPGQIMGMSDDELRVWTLSGPENSYVHKIGQTEMNMRCALRMVNAASQMAEANRDLVEATRRVVEGHHGLIRQTRYLVKATWGIVIITLISQVAVVSAELMRR
jgi:hypothetical protein